MSHLDQKSTIFMSHLQSYHQISSAINSHFSLSFKNITCFSTTYVTGSYPKRKETSSRSSIMRLEREYGIEMKNRHFDNVTIFRSSIPHSINPIYSYFKTGPSFKSVDSPFRPVVKVVALIAA